jgi:hypothetical protein
MTDGRESLVSAVLAADLFAEIYFGGLAWATPWVSLLAILLAVNALTCGAIWLARTDTTGRPVVRFLDRVRRCLAYEGDPDAGGG